MRPVHLRDPDGTPVISVRVAQGQTHTGRNRTSTLEGPGVCSERRSSAPYALGVSLEVARARAVLEFPAGTSAYSGIRPGSRLRLSV